ncbi:uncharacterized protein J3R85_015171 [Psidium guajava]|nr:uncharacterized protein J3R85_015171 [Psidium guajava]
MSKPCVRGNLTCLIFLPALSVKVGMAWWTSIDA